MNAEESKDYKVRVTLPYSGDIGDAIGETYTYHIDGRTFLTARLCFDYLICGVGLSRRDALDFVNSLPILPLTAP